MYHVFSDASLLGSAADDAYGDGDMSGYSKCLQPRTRNPNALIPGWGPLY